MESLAFPKDSQPIYLPSVDSPQDGTSHHQGNHVPASGRGQDESSEVVLRPLKNQSGSPGVPESPKILACPAPRGGNPAHPARLRSAREPASAEPRRPGAGRNAQPRLRARVRTAPWEARAQLILAMETGAVLEASGQLLVGPISSLGRDLPTYFSRGDVVPGRALVASPLR